MLWLDAPLKNDPLKVEPWGFLNAEMQTNQASGVNSTTHLCTKR